MLQTAAGTRPAITVFGDDYDDARRDLRSRLHPRRPTSPAPTCSRSAPVDGARVYNLGCGGDGTTVNEVIDAARAVTGRKIAAHVGARRAGDPARLVRAPRAPSATLGWRPALADIRVIVESAWRFAESRER